MPATPTARAVERLVRLAGMLGSDFEGERANAAALATRALQAHGLTWRELVERAFAHRPAPEPVPRPPRSGPAHLARWLLNQPGDWSEWERKFLANLSAWHGAPTAKQLGILQRLADRVVTTTEAAA